MDRHDDTTASAAGSLQAATAALGARALGLVETRLELAGVELAQARERLVASLLLAAAAFGCGLLALVVATFGVIAWFWNDHRFAAIVVLVLVYGVTTAVLWSRFDTLRRDADRLRGAGDATADTPP
jgi:uncharacterized membrane protein YqjE